nr:MAG TPA: hypothetical protein [Caudoviricetes sp.]
MPQIGCSRQWTAVIQKIGNFRNCLDSRKGL